MPQGDGDPVIAAWFIAFAAGAILDYASARYVAAVAADRVAQAGAWSIAMYLLSSVGLYGLVEVSPWLVLPTCGGLAAGTALAMRPPSWIIPRGRGVRDSGGDCDPPR